MLLDLVAVGSSLFRGNTWSLGPRLWHGRALAAGCPGARIWAGAFLFVGGRLDLPQQIQNEPSRRWRENIVAILPGLLELLPVKDNRC